MKYIKFVLNSLLLLTLIGILKFHTNIANWIQANIIYKVPNEIIINNNEYSTKASYNYIQITDNFIVKDYQQLLNVFYTILDSGNTKFTFYCDKEYPECINDINKIIPDISEDSFNILSEINNFVHPFNSYSSVTVTTTNFGKITVTFTKQYTDEMINFVNNRIDQISNEILTDDMSTYDKILAFHDYIVNNTKYDQVRAVDITGDAFKNSLSHTAYGLLNDHIALCGGYSDTMSIFLYRLGIPNYKVAGLNHVWNLLFYDNKWINLDMTWDDPITSDNSDILLHEYFMISSSDLLALDAEEHKADYQIYAEANVPN